MWFASPAAGMDGYMYNRDFLLGTEGVGISLWTYDDSACGLRPIVCLNSSVQLEMIDSETYAII